MLDKSMAQEAMTIVVPVKDRATLVLKTLNSIKGQTWRPLKLIVVDNNSTDGTPESVARWIESNREEGFEASLLSETTPGPSAARNAGLQDVDTRLVMFFDSDDIMQPGHVESIMRRFHAGDEPDLVTFRVRYHLINGSDRITKKGRSNAMLTQLCNAHMCTAGFACETALARRAGGWDEALSCWVDLEYGTRLLLEARRRASIDDVNVDVYARADSVTGTEFTSRRGQWEKALDKIAVNFEKSRHKERERWAKVLAYRKAILAAAYRKENNREAAEALLNEALSLPSLNFIQRLYIKLAYRCTALGIRGTAIPLRLFF
ncbi:MAG: glycosyltransferase family 2 protein [Muribaculaceae bacterium]|nr:glycosyltransferase family 2 protein [Muribaculaceae bacterium]